MDNEIIERVAEAIYNRRMNHYKEIPVKFAELFPRTKSPYIADAKAAIKAMREPTEKMEDAAYEGEALEEGSSAYGCWQLMIDSIINE